MKTMRLPQFGLLDRHKPEEQILTALDIGTSKTAAIVGRTTAGEELEVLGVGTCPSGGLKKGVVINIEETVHSIRRAVEEAEVMAETHIVKVYAGVSGSHIKSLSCEGMASIKDNEVRQSDIEQAIETAQAIQLPADQRVLHVLPRHFSIDGQGGIKDPIGMSGYRLHANVHMVTGAVHPINNIIKCIRRCKLDIADIVLEQIASSQAVLDKDERELGVCLLDIGGGTTDIAVFSKGTVMHTAVIPIAGDHVTNDIAVTLRTPTKNAEEIKLKYGCALKQFAGEEERIEVPSIADRPPTSLRRRSLVEVIQPRYEELFKLVRQELGEKGLENLIPAGFVLTGGSAKIEGARELAESVFNAPVRIGKPCTGITGLADIVNNPIHATGIGLLRFAETASAGSGSGGPLGVGVGSAWGKFKNWFQRNF